MHDHIYDEQHILTMALELGFKEEEDGTTKKRDYRTPQGASLDQGKRLLIRTASDEELLHLRKKKELHELRTAFGSGASTGLGNDGSRTVTNEALGADRVRRATMAPKVEVGILTQLKQLRKDEAQLVGPVHQCKPETHTMTPLALEVCSLVEESKSDSYAPAHDHSLEQRLVQVVNLLDRLRNESHCSGMAIRDTAIFEEQTRVAQERAKCLMDEIHQAGAHSTAPSSAASSRNPAEISPVVAHGLGTQSVVRVERTAANLPKAVPSPKSKAEDTGVASLVEPEADPLKALMEVASPQEPAAIDNILVSEMPAMLADQAVVSVAKDPTALDATLDLLDIASNLTGDLQSSAPLSVVSGPAPANSEQLTIILARDEPSNASSLTMASTPVSTAASPVVIPWDTTRGKPAEPPVHHAGLVVTALTLSSAAPIAQPVVDPFSALVAPQIMPATAAIVGLAEAVQSSVICDPTVTATLETPANPIETHGLSMPTPLAIGEALVIETPLVSEMNLIVPVAAEASLPTPPMALIAVTESVDDALPLTRALSASLLDHEAAEEITTAPTAASSLEPNTSRPTSTILDRPSENASGSESSEADLGVSGQVSNVVAGTRVCVGVGLFSSNTSKLWLDEGLTGKVVRLDDAGDALVELVGLKSKQWISKSKFQHLLVYQFEVPLVEFVGLK
jgi:hypothetical protein